MGGFIIFWSYFLSVFFPVFCELPCMRVPLWFYQEHKRSLYHQMWDILSSWYDHNRENKPWLSLVKQKLNLYCISSESPHLGVTKGWIAWYTLLVPFPNVSSFWGNWWRNMVSGLWFWGGLEFSSFAFVPSLHCASSLCILSLYVWIFESPLTRKSCMCAWVLDSLIDIVRPTS